MSRPPLPRVSTIKAILRASREIGATSVTLADGTTVRFIEDAPGTAISQAPVDEWTNALPFPAKEKRGS